MLEKVEDNECMAKEKKSIKRITGNKSIRYQKISFQKN